MATDSKKEWSMEGKTVIVTGSNSGIGKFTAMGVLKRGAARVILACRNMASAEEAAKDIREAAGISADDDKQVVCRQLDLSSQKSVREFAAKINAEEPQLHVLINNAGLFAPNERTFSEDGYEMTFATNHLGHFLLTNLLLDLLKKSAPSRIVLLSSEGYKFCWQFGLAIDDITKIEKEKYVSGKAYARSKLCNLLHGHALNKRLQDSGVTVYVVHPGLINSGLFRYQSTIFNILFWPLYKFVFTTPEQGAETSIYCASQPGIENLSGKYFKYCAVNEAWAVGKDDEMAEKLWQLSVKCTSHADKT